MTTKRSIKRVTKRKAIHALYLPKGRISRDEAFNLAPDYVKFVEGDFSFFRSVENEFVKLKKGQKVISYIDGNFVLCKVSVVSHGDIRAMDGPFVRVSNGEYSWRVDGSGYAYPCNI